MLKLLILHVSHVFTLHLIPLVHCPPAPFPCIPHRAQCLIQNKKHQRVLLFYAARLDAVRQPVLVCVGFPL